MKTVGRVSFAELEVAGKLRLSYPPFDVCVVWDGGEIYAIEDACNHAGASLSEGSVAGGKISCPMHGYLFDLARGTLVAPVGLCGDQRTFRVRREGDDVIVEDHFELDVHPPDRA